MRATLKPLTIAKLMALSVMLFALPETARAEVVDFESDRWVMKNAGIVDHLGRKALVGVAYLKDVEFESGVIEIDLAVNGDRAYPGIIFRMSEETEYEHIYVRPHTNRFYPHAIQYAPTFNGVACWQLYHGNGFTGPAVIPANEWMHLKVEVSGTQARFYLNDMNEPALVIHRLVHGASKGTIGVSGQRNGTAYFSNFRYTPDDTLRFDPPPAIEPTSHAITDWAISRPFPAGQIDTENYPGFFQIFGAGWRSVQSEPSGLVNVSKHAARSRFGADSILARTMVQSNKKRDIKLSFGYSDNVTLFFNGRKVFSGQSGYRSRDPSFAGLIGYHDSVYLTLEKGLNEIFLMVTETFGGWGFMAKTERALHPPVKQHDRLTKVWETPDVFKIPESVLYDPKRQILYVSNFVKVNNPERNTGFISRLSLDGAVENLEWVTGLDGPCGMAMHDDKLFVVESSGHLVEIDPDTGAVRERYPAPNSTFLNDVIADRTGNIYISNTTRRSEARDIYRLRDGAIKVWKEGDDLHRTNGLFLHDQRLLVGNTGDGSLKTVALDDGRVDQVACLGAGVVDGIRVDDEGNYLVSHWEGQVYRISPSGEVVEILDTMGEGLNTADFEFIKEKNLLIIPTFLGNKVVAHRLAG